MTLLFLSSQYSLSHPPKRGSPSILTIECVLANERLRLLTRLLRAWSYFLPRLGPGPISTHDSEIILPVPNSHHVVPGTLARPRQIVTMIMTVRRKFMRRRGLDKANRRKNSQTEERCCRAASKSKNPPTRFLDGSLPCFFLPCADHAGPCLCRSSGLLTLAKVRY